VAERAILIDGFSFLEGPRWYDGALHVSDMHGHRVLRVELDGTTSTLLEHSAPVSGLGWLPGGRLIVVAMDGDILLLDDADVTVLADLRPLAPHGINDMINHPSGWAYVGQFGYDRHAGQPVVASPLLRVDADGRTSIAAEELLVANGMCLSRDATTLLVAESAGNRVASFAVRDDGALTKRSVFAELPTRHAPDGMCLDAEGAVWVAAVTAGAFLRVEPGGTVTHRIELEEGRNPIACVLGGVDRRTLFLLTAATFGEADKSRDAMSARIEVVDVDVPGDGWP
jgi:sugar lactone lactonase YvrE